MEETGIKIKNIKYVGSQPWPFPDQLMLAFTAEYESGEIRIQEEEIQDAAWFDRENLPLIPNPGSVAYNLILGKFKENKG
jgi:NAD+ diphosphatase